MSKRFLPDVFGRMNEKLFFLLIIFIQVLFIFQGLDFADSGFHSDFYSRIYSDPSTVQYNFIYWFTGILGGAWLKVFPGLGLLGLRLAGVVVTTITLLVTYNLLKRYLHSGPLHLSLLLIIFFLSTSIKEFNYDDVSALFFVCASWFLFKGLTKEKFSGLFMAGVFISLNTFSRMPNLLGLGLILVIWFSGYLNHETLQQVVLRSVLFICGFLVMSVALIVLMKVLHHDQIFLNNLKLVREIGSSSENSQTLFAILKLYVLQYGEAIATSIVALVILWSIAAAWRRLNADLPVVTPFLPLVKYIILVALTIACVYRAWRDPEFWFILYLFYAGTCLVVGFLIITGRQPKNLRLMAAMGCIMLLVLPVGSNFVLVTVGKYAMWIILPITIDYLLTIRALSSRVVVSENSQHFYEQRIDEESMTGLRNVCMYLTLVFVLSVTYFFPYFDRSDRAGMHYTIKNAHLHWIYTTKRRASVVNELLTQSARYVKPDDYVLAFESIPMYYYLTDTRPYMHNSWPWLYDKQVFSDELNKSLQETKVFPVVIMQKRSTIGNNWPDHMKDELVYFPEIRVPLEVFLKNYHYSKVWENDFFEIYVPAVKTPSLNQYVNR